MFYYLAQALTPYYSAFNVFSYHTVRAGGAALTGFLFSLIIGPWIIRKLRELKIGQVIKKEHVANLHALHKGKEGTPTMGGTMMLIAAVFSLLFWSTLKNRLMWIALVVFFVLGLVGFIDDYIKLKRKHNDGLSARAKFTGQIVTGVVLGLYLYIYPITVGAGFVQPRDVLDWEGLARSFSAASATDESPSARHLAERVDKETREAARAALERAALSDVDRRALLKGLHSLLELRDLYEPELWKNTSLNGESHQFIAQGLSGLSDRDNVRFNRLLLEAAMPHLIAKSQVNLNTKVGVPGFKETMIPLGMFYVVFVIVIIVSMSNAVNLTDGLDGLAAGASIVSIMAYTAIAYVVSRADWSEYLYVTYVPEASELFVFGATLLGTGLGFLWFNSHPAEVFMGDTGSLALGGAIASMAILTKQELLLPIVGGIFVLEAGSVLLQVASFKMTGKRVFRMAPLHHHFEMLGWAEPKVTMRFWIIALLFALLSLSTLKLR